MPDSSKIVTTVADRQGAMQTADESTNAIRTQNGHVFRYQPDLVICGHIHEAPFERHLGGLWHCRIGRTVMVNAGQWHKRRWPCHLQIDRDTVIWRAPGHPRESVKLAQTPTTS